MLSLITPHDVQLELQAFIRFARKDQKISVAELADMSGVPYGTIRKFEATGNISLRQFLMLYAVVGQLADVQKLVKIESTPKSIDEVLNRA